ncbi:MAG: serine hydrolase [Candidatus Lokiarchaeota archaeon]|nr:serine hydrolase [Candidatus Harpocratesius repetitus]
MINQEIQSKIEELIINNLQESQIPALSIAIVENNQVIYANGFGARRIRGNLPASEKTLYGIGSSTKSFTALAIMQLVEEEKINLDDPVQKYITFKLGSEKKPITIRHLLSHSSGIPDLDASIRSIVEKVCFPDPLFPMSSKNDFLRHVNRAQSEFFFDPGEHFFYNNDMFTLLLLIIEKITGMPFEEYIQKKILLPLDMKRSTFSKEVFDNDPLNDKFTGYMIKPGPDGINMQETDFPFNWLLYACGGLISSVDEMSNYLITMLNKGVYNGKKIISSKYFDELWKTIISSPYGAGKNPQYCLGWIREDDFFNTTLIHHGGNTGMSSSYMALLPEKKIGVVMESNTNFLYSSTLTREILTLLLGKNLDELDVFHRKKILQNICGVYHSYQGINKLEVNLQGGKLFGTITSGPSSNTFPLYALDFAKLRFSIPKPYFGNDPGMEFQFFVSSESNKVLVTADRFLFHKIN